MEYEWKGVTRESGCVDGGAPLYGSASGAVALKFICLE